MEKLFSYETLQFVRVQRDIFGSVLIGNKGKLEQHVISKIKITNTKIIESSDTCMHPILKYTANKTAIVIGPLFDLTDKELISIYEDEITPYKYAEVTFKFGKTGFIYFKN